MGAFFHLSNVLYIFVKVKDFTVVVFFHRSSLFNHRHFLELALKDLFFFPVIIIVIFNHYLVETQYLCTDPVVYYDVHK